MKRSKSEWKKWKRSLKEYGLECERKYEGHSRYYLAYGSNLSVLQMQQRCPTSMPLTMCNLLDYKLVFSDVATVEPCKGSVVPSAVWKVEPEDIDSLDIYEGFPTLYGKRFATLDIDGVVQTLFFYVLDCEYHESTPSPSYFNTLAEGYAEWKLDVNCLIQAEASAENNERDRAGTPTECQFCHEVGLSGEMEHTRHYGWLCPDCHGIMFYGVGTTGLAVPTGDDDMWGRGSSYDYSTSPEPVYDEDTGGYYNPSELDWAGGKYVDDGQYISKYRGWN